MKNFILSLRDKVSKAWSFGVDWFDTVALCTFIALSLLAFCLAVTTAVSWAFRFVSVVPIIGVVLVTLIVALFLRASWYLWTELYDNDLLSIRNLILAHLGLGVATVGELVKKLFNK